MQFHRNRAQPRHLSPISLKDYDVEVFVNQTKISSLISTAITKTYYHYFFQNVYF